MMMCRYALFQISHNHKIHNTNHTCTFIKRYTAKRCVLQNSVSLDHFRAVPGGKLGSISNGSRDNIVIVSAVSAAAAAAVVIVVFAVELLAALPGSPDSVGISSITFAGRPDASRTVRVDIVVPGDRLADCC